MGIPAILGVLNTGHKSMKELMDRGRKKIKERRVKEEEKKRRKKPA